MRELPLELIVQIIQYAEPRTSLLGQPGVKHPSIAYVSSKLRAAYLQEKSCFDFSLDQCHIPYPTIGETLNFPDLRSLAKFFTNGPGRRDDQSIQGKYLDGIKFIRIVYRDHWAIPFWEFGGATYAYEAFELLVANLDRMKLQQLQLCFVSYPTIHIDSPGIWSLLKVRDLKSVILSSQLIDIHPAVCEALETRLCWPPSHRWSPLGFENPGPGDWHHRVSREGPAEEWERQYEWLDRRYLTLHDRQTIDARAKLQRKIRDRRYGLKRQARKQRHWHRQRQTEMERAALDMRRK